MIGQSKIQTNIKNLTLDNFNTPILLQGKFGCGKHLVTDIIAEQFNLTIRSFSAISNDLLSEIIQSQLNQLCIFDISIYSVSEQSKLLKFLEEHPQNIFIVLLNDSNIIIEPILNRCIIWEFEPYTKKELIQFATTNSQFLIDFCETPGDVIQFNQVDIQAYYNLATKIVKSISIANYANLFVISQKFDKEKDNIIILLKLLAYLFLLENNMNAYQLTIDSLASCQLKNSNKIFELENYLFKLKQLLR